nr:hypothetical protein [Tanacetum cinerariifolium]
MNCHVTTTLPLPRSHIHALSDPNWQKAMVNEYNALISNRMWALVPRRANVIVVRCMWLFRHKFNAYGSLSRYKARLVANGRSQQGIDCDETFSLVVKPTTIHIVLSLAVSQDCPFHQLNVKNAFLHGLLSKTVYMHQPLGLIDSRHPDYVCHLQRSLYGFKQAPHAWFQRFAGFVTRIVFSTSKLIRPYLFFIDVLILLVSYYMYVTSFSLLLLQLFYNALLHYFTSKFAEEILERADMQSCNTCKTHVDTDFKLGSVGEPLHVSSTSQLIAYTDDDGVGCPVTCRSTSGAETESHRVSNVVAKISCIRNFLRELHTPLFTAILVYCDNISVVYMSANPIHHQRTKHIEIDIYFVCDFVASGQCMSTRSTSSNLFSPLRDPESLIRRRNLGEPSSLFDFEEVMSIPHNNQGPPPAGPPPPQNNNGSPPVVRPKGQLPDRWRSCANRL